MANWKMTRGTSEGSRVSFSVGIVEDRWLTELGTIIVTGTVRASVRPRAFLSDVAAFNWPEQRLLTDFLF